MTTGPALWPTRGRAAAAAHGETSPGRRFYLRRASRLRPLLTYALPGGVRPGPARDDPCLHHARRPRGGRGGSCSGRRHPPATTDLGVLAEPGWPVASRSRQRHFARHRRLVAHGRRTATSAVACPRTCRTPKSASGCMSPRTRSRRRRTPPTGSLASPRAARLSSARVNSAWTPSNHVFRRTRGYLRGSWLPGLCGGSGAGCVGARLS